MQIGSNQAYGTYQTSNISSLWAQADNGGQAETSSYDGYYDGYEVDFSPEAAAELNGG